MMYSKNHLKKSNNTIILIVLLFLLLHSCDNKSGIQKPEDKPKITFNLTIQNDSVLLWNGKQSSFSGFELLVGSSVDSIGKLEYNINQVIVSIRANEETDLGDIEDLMMVLRHRGIRQVKYH